MNILPPETQPQMAADWFRAWFGDDYPDKFVILSQMMPGSGRTITRHRAGTAAELIEGLEALGLEDLVYADNRQWNLYMSVGVLSEKPANGRKGGKKDIDAVPGVWVDLDTDKVGFFDDGEACLDLLRKLPQEVWPSIVVQTGTGGVHAYWKTTEPLTREQAERLCVMWWSYLSSRTEAKIDKLVNADRVMKLPGSIRWPKSTGDSPTLVTLLYADGGRRIPQETLEAHAQEAYDDYVGSIKERTDRIERNRNLAREVVIDPNNRWSGMMATANLQAIEDHFNDTRDWDDILIPLGWTKMDQDGEGRDIWARPGLSSWELHKSAATDFNGSNVMSLFSDSSETGLSHLLDTGVVLTKYRVWVEAKYAGDEAAFVRDWYADVQE